MSSGRPSLAQLIGQARDDQPQGVFVNCILAKACILLISIYLEINQVRPTVEHDPQVTKQISSENEHISDSSESLLEEQQKLQEK